MKIRKLFVATLLLFCPAAYVNTAMAQTEHGQSVADVICRGTVIDSQGEPVIGATVQVLGASNAVATDVDGKFSLKSVTKGAKLRVSCIGYDAVDIVWNGTPLNVTLAESSTTLSEVVTIGYGTQKKVNLTGSVSSVSSKELQDMPVANTSTLLQGRVPGLVMTSNGAQAGNDTPEMRIRGVGTFGNNNPMVLVDGVEISLSQISDIAASDIDNISVLKDAASAAIYGVRAANGVILITTKGGQKSDVRVNYNGSVTLQTVGIRPSYVDGYNWALMKNEVYPNAYSAEALEALKNGTDPDHYANTDWLDAVTRDAFMTQHHLSVSGGNESTKYMASVNYAKQDGIMKYTGVEKYGFRANVDSKYKRFTFGLNVAGNKNNVQSPGVDASGSSSVMRYISWFTRPTVPVQYSDGNYGWVDGSSWATAEQVKNPLYFMSRGYRFNEQWRLNSKAWAALDIYDGLKFQTNLSYSIDFNQTKTYTPIEDNRYDADGNISKASAGNNQETDYWYRLSTVTNENLLTYNNTFAGVHTVGVLLGHSTTRSRWYNTTASIQGYPTDNIYELSGGTINPSVSGTSEEYRLQSFFGRLTYSYDSRYLFEFNVRRDGSSRMPKAHRYATFPSVSVGWVFTNEKFMEDYARILSMGKLRASWGKLGNQEIGNYAYSATLAASGNYYFDESADKQAGMVLTSVANEDIKWETTRNINIAVDLGFWNNRIQTSFDWYDKKTTDILMQLSMPGIFLGSLSAPYQNVGAVRNRGWEWTASYNDSKGDFSWHAGLSLSRVKNTILSMGDLEESIGSNTINRVGEAIDSYYGYKAIGIYRTEADLNRTNAEGKVITQNGSAPSLGDIMYEDVDGNGNIDANDRTIIGNPFPKLSYSFTLGGSWKNLDINTLWQGVAGIYRYNWETTTDIKGNFTDRWLDRWSSTNVNGSMPRLGNDFNNQYSSFWLDKADYLRLKNLEIGYTFNQPSLSVVGISNIRLYLAATDLLTITPLKGFDPEKSSGDSRGDVHPNARTYSFGVNISF